MWKVCAEPSDSADSADSAGSASVFQLAKGSQGSSSFAKPVPLHLQGALTVWWKQLQMEAHAVVKIRDTVEV